MLALAGLVFVLMVTAAWWALALWPAGPDAPRWLARTQAICFGVSATGLPDLSGWIGLVASPLGIIALLLISGRRAFGRLVIELRHSRWLQVTGFAIVVGLIACAALATSRVRELAGASSDELLVSNSGSAMRIDRPAPALRLTDQFGRDRDLSGLRGRAVLVLFAYAHCETVCPVLVHNAVVAQRELARTTPFGPALVIITLDPLRDTPSRLGSIARQWQLGPDAYVLSGTVEQVNDVLDRWNVARSYDSTNGNVTHASVAYVVDDEGRIAYEVMAPSSQILIQLVRSL